MALKRERSPSPETGFVQLVDDGYPPGLRGLHNLGNTCFMNSVLQVLFQTPYILHYHLGACHSADTCEHARDEEAPCLICELDCLLSAAYSGCRAPVSPACFLHAWWSAVGGDMARHAQQDAHEFLVFFLDALSAIRWAEYPVNDAFSGSLESEVVCSACQHRSVTEDRFLHLSLDIPPATRLIAPAISTPETNGTDAKPKGTRGRGNKGGAIAAGRGAGRRGGRKGPGFVKRDFPREEDENSEVLDPSGGSSMLDTPSLLSPRGSQESELLVSTNEDLLSVTMSGEALSSPRPSSFNAGYPSFKDAYETQSGNKDGFKGEVGGKNLGDHPALASFTRWPGASLLGALRRLTHREHLGAPGNRWHCAACGASDGATKRLSLAKLPPILVLHAKRFEHSALKGTATKLNTFLEYPLENLDMSPFLSTRLPSTEVLYDLYGVIVHKGDFKGGHYVTYLKCRDGAWYLCDDSFVSRATSSEVQNSQAYMLFYASKQLVAWNSGD